MTSVLRRTTSRGQAQSMVEFALVIPLFLLLLFALIDFARLEFGYISLANAAREMARAAAIPPPTALAADVTTSSMAVDQSFKNFEGMLLSAPNPAVDSVTITVTDRACLAVLAAGTGPCVSPDVPTTSVQNGVSGACTLPLDPDSTHPATYCAIPTRFGLAGGSVDVKASFRFTFSPLFQNRLTGIVDASFMQQWATLTTTARAYIE